MTKTALVVEGGALRSVFSSGVLDGFILQSFDPFDFYLGVSAGASNLAFYKAGHYGRSYQLFCEIINSKKLINYRQFLMGGHLLDLDWLYTKYINHKTLDLVKVFDTKRPLYVCVTEVATGKARYITASKDNFPQLFKASMALPLVYRHFPSLDGNAMVDGGVADSIPVQRAIDMGATKIMVIRARHQSYLKKDTTGHKIIRRQSRKHPQLLKTMRDRIALHKQAINTIRQPPPGIQIIEICPPESFTPGRFSHNLKQLALGYENGLMQSTLGIDMFIS